MQLSGSSKGKTVENLSGTNIKGYELRERIGAGGFGAVYKAHQSTVGREVAIKIILPHFASHPDFIRRFETEAQLVARLEHLHIIPLYDYWRDPNGAYLVMRWLKGGSLREALEGGAFSLPAAVRLLDQITSALSAAHRNNVIHRDLKPGNILLDEEGNAYLADFGIAKDIGVANGITEVDAIIGSPDYLAPEQARGEQVTPSTDIYSLGVVLYEVLAGQHPFPQISSVERLYKHLNDPLPEITVLPDDTRDAINGVILKATAKNPIHRYADVLEMAAAFRHAAQTAAPDSMVETLTQREQTILQLVIDGLSNKEIAQRLFITVITVKWHITQIYRKLGVRSRVQAIVRARELDLIGSSGDAVVPTTIIPTEDFKPDNPYKGLRAFQSADHADFFGREKLVQKLVKRLSEAGDGSRFLAVVGPSGSGKSSLVKAGLILELWRGAVPDSEKWFIVEMLPGAHPLEELEIALTRVAANQAGNLHEHLERDERGLLRAANLILPNDDSELVLVLDQFEEVFTMVENEVQRVHFLDLLHAAVTDPRSRVRVILTLRADYYDRPLHYQVFGELLRNRMETVLPLSAAEIERAIAKPAERVGAKFEEGLVASIVSEVNYQPAALPLLQYALTELFEQRKGRILTREAYDALGRSVGALAKRADELFLALDNDGQEITRQMFLRLVTLGDGAEDTRRRTDRSELLAAGSDPDAADEILDTYAAYRLLTLDHDPGTRTPTVELAHEALIREWERLKIWLNESRAEIRLQRQLISAAQEWRDAGEDASFVLRGSRLEMFEGWAAQSTLALTSREKHYLDASIAVRRQEESAETTRKAKEVVLEQRSVNRLRWLVAILVAAVLGTLLLSSLVMISANNEREAREQAEDNLSLAQAAQATSEINLQHAEALRFASSAAGLLPGSGDNAELAALLAIHSLNIRYSSQADSALLEASRLLFTEALYPRPYPPSQVLGYSIPRFLPDGLSVLIITQDETVQRYNMETGVLTDLYDGTLLPTVAALSPDGEWAFIGFEDGSLQALHTRTGEVDFSLGGQGSPVIRIALSDDRQHLAITREDRTVSLWDVPARQLRHTVDLGSFGTGWLDFSPDSAVLAVPKNDNFVDLVDVERGEILHRLGGGLDWMESADFSSDGSLLLTASADGTARVWDVASGEEVRSFAGHRAALANAYFSPDDRFVLTSSSDGTARLWDSQTGEEVRRFSGHHGGLRYAGFSPDATQIVTASVEENSWRVWDAQLDSVPDRMVDHDFGGFYSWGARFSLDGRWIITGFAAKPGIGLYDAHTRQHVRDIDPEGSYIAPFALSPDGQYVLGVADEDRDDIHLLLIDLNTGTVSQTYRGHTGRIMDAAFSPDGQQIITVSEDGTARLWETATGQQVHLYPHEGGVSAVGFSRDGASVFTGGYANAVMHQWDTVTGQEIRQFATDGNAIFHLIVSLDGEHVIGGGDSGMSAWDIDSGEPVWAYSEIGFRVDLAALSPDGTVLATAGSDGSIRLWNPETGEERRRLTGFDAAPYSLDFSPDGNQLITNVGVDTLQIWMLDWRDLEVQACASIFRDFNASERAIYGIAGDQPTCPQFAPDT